MSDGKVLELGDIALRSGMTPGETGPYFTAPKRALTELLETRV
ncbi:MAG TPA: hypothetical protein VJN67_20725 [Stellaceae bacterium]|nr:hypothetical protein [Stellaceae bacterium]